MADDRSGSSDPIGNGGVLILLLYVRVDASLLGKLVDKNARLPRPPPAKNQNPNFTTATLPDDDISNKRPINLTDISNSIYFVRCLAQATTPRIGSGSDAYDVGTAGVGSVGWGEASIWCDSWPAPT
eukprot:scaffold14295_cov193-Alexandrium_tamarense.AAC.5